LAKVNEKLCWFAFEIIREPTQLLIAERAQSARFQIGDIDEADEMHAAGVEIVPAGALGGLTFERADRSIPVPGLLSCFRVHPPRF
jgi:hypothetical protein